VQKKDVTHNHMNGRIFAPFEVLSTATNAVTCGMRTSAARWAWPAEVCPSFTSIDLVRHGIFREAVEFSSYRWQPVQMQSVCGIRTVHPPWSHSSANRAAYFSWASPCSSNSKIARKFHASHTYVQIETVWHQTWLAQQQKIGAKISK